MPTNVNNSALTIAVPFLDSLTFVDVRYPASAAWAAASFATGTRNGLQLT
jgi:hypothetical protein